MNNDSDTADQDIIQHHQEVLVSHRERLAFLLAQLTQRGNYAPAHILTDIRDTQEALRPIKAWLRAKGIPIADEPNDEAQMTLDLTPSHYPSDTAD